MKRRQFIKASVITGATVGIGGVLWVNDSTDKSLLTINSVLNEIDALIAQSVVSIGTWNINQIMVHCAQSVEYSMTGYPEHKSEFFKRTLGKFAFSAFAAKGEMLHALDEEIPGAIKLTNERVGSRQQSFERLANALRDFQKYNGTLAPHFAYGVLTKAEYELAHAMHFYNHLTEVKQQTA